MIVECYRGWMAQYRLRQQRPIYVDLDERWARVYQGRQPPTVTSIPDLVFAPEQADALAQWLNRHLQRVVILRVPQAWVLLRAVQLPAQARAHLSRVIQYEMDRLTPFAPESVYFTFKAHGQSATGALDRIDLAVVPKGHAFGPWTHVLSGLKMVDLRLTWEGAWTQADLLQGQQSRQRSWVSRLWRWGLWSMASFAVLAILLWPLWMKREEAKVLDQQLRQLTSQLPQVTSVRTQLEQIQTAGAFVGEKRKARPLVMDIVREMTNILPANVWLHHLSLRDDEVRIEGEAVNASALLGLIEASPLLMGASFAAPVVPLAQEGKEQFQIQCRIEWPGDH